MSTPATIPICDPRAGYLARRAGIDAALARVCSGGRYILGPEVDAFEREFAAYLGTREAVGTASGADALVLALRALGAGPGDAVLTVSHTAFATVAAIEAVGAVPALVDIDPATYTLDPAALADVIASWTGPRLVGVIPVHLYGHPSNMPAIRDIADRHGLWILEDCAQAHGASIADRKVGAWGEAAAFSFYPTKNLGALGDGGAVVTSDAALAARLRLLRQCGWRERYVSEEVGMTTRLDELQAAVLRVRLPNLDEDNRRRRSIARAYDERLSETGLDLPPRGDGSVYQHYVVRSTRREGLRLALANAGIQSLVHYPRPIHLQPAFAGRLPIARPLTQTERAANEVLSLPMYPELEFAAVARVADAVRDWAGCG